MDGARDGNLQRKPRDLQRTTGVPEWAGDRRREWFGDKPRVVAAVHSPETLRAAEALRAAPGAAPDLLELRVDHFADDPGVLDALAADSPRPLVVTVRRGEEGGAVPDLDEAERRRLYLRFLPTATCVDVEVRSLEALSEVVAEARRMGVWVIASFHDFRSPSGDLARLREVAGQAAAGGADVLKVAEVTAGPGDLARLLGFLAEESRLPVAIMGMGRMGKVSRVVLGAAGSVLNYGYLGERAQVPGQWPAAVLRERIEEASRED